ncbi:DUF7706 family protein [Paraburkholderia hospita]|uniref:DUF7706 family protein n=1 Tax=Paraburkholderia hospita TaxID=169430 RepID=UPI003F4F42C1
MTGSSESNEQGCAELSVAETLVQFPQPMGWPEMHHVAIDDDDAYLMRSTVEKVQRALAGVGYSRR